MPSLSEVIEYRKRQFDQSMDLIAKKGADYNRDQQENGDTLFNLRVCELLGIVPSTEEGILVRLSDKFMRLISLTKPGREAMVKDESVEDTIRDIHNYVDYLGLIWLQRRQSRGIAKVPLETLSGPTHARLSEDRRVDLIAKQERLDPNKAEYHSRGY